MKQRKQQSKATRAPKGRDTVRVTRLRYSLDRRSDSENAYRNGHETWLVQAERRAS